MHLKISGQDWPTPIMGNTGAELLPAKTEFFLLEEEDTQLDWSPSLRNTIQRKICGIVIAHLSHWYTIRIIHQWICNKAVSGAISTLFIGLAEDDLIFFRRRISSELLGMDEWIWQYQELHPDQLRVVKRLNQTEEIYSPPVRVKEWDWTAVSSQQ